MHSRMGQVKFVEDPLKKWSDLVCLNRSDHITSKFLKAVFNRFTWSILQYIVWIIIQKQIINVTQKQT